MNRGNDANSAATASSSTTTTTAASSNSANNNKNSSAASNTNQENASNITVASNESIKTIAESIGISNLSEEACRELASDLTFTIKSILIDAQKFSRKSRRKKLIPSDIDFALKARLIEPIYGFNSMEQVPFRCATMSGGNGSGRSIYYTEDQVVDLVDLVSKNNLNIKVPNEFVINAHWLAIEGVQPSVPENPQLVSREAQRKETMEGAKSKEKSQQQQKRNLTENLVKLKSLIPHDLSVEQQIYFKEITEACVGSDEQKRTEALNSLGSDPGLHQLLPRLILFISEGVRVNIIQHNMAILIYLMRMAKSLVENRSIYLEKYLHELIPSIISCVLSKQVCIRPDVDNHWAIREFCAHLVGQIVKTYSPTIPSLQSRIIKIFLKSIQSEKTTFATLFGAIAGLSELGNEISESFVFPIVKMLAERITQILDSPASSLEKTPADKVKQQLTRIVSNVLKTKQTQTSNEFDYLITEFGAYFGPLIHAQLMKHRNQQSNIQQAAGNKQQRIIAPQIGRGAGGGQQQAGVNQFLPARPPTNGQIASPASPFISPKPIGQTQPASSNPASAALTNSTSNFSADSPNTQKLVKVVHSTTTTTTTLHPATTATTTTTTTTQANTKIENDFINFESSNKVEANHNTESNVQKDEAMDSLKNFKANSVSSLNDNSFESVVNNDLAEKVSGTHENNTLTNDNQQMNMSSLTNDSNNLSDVNLSDNVETNCNDSTLQQQQQTTGLATVGLHLIEPALKQTANDLHNLELNKNEEIKPDDQEMLCNVDNEDEDCDDEDDENNLSGEI